MAAPAKTKTWSTNEVLTSSALNTQFDDWVSYVGDRNDGTEAWDICNVTSTSTTNLMKLSTNQAITELSIDNTATDGDSILTLKLGGTINFAIGLDDGDSDTLKIGTTAIGTSTMLKADSTGTINYPLQPAFLVTAPSNPANSTGDGTAHTVNYDTEIFDQNSDFDTGTFTFTAPVTGRYFLSASAQLTGMDVVSDGQMEIVTSNRTYTFSIVTTSTDALQFTRSVVADMDASDTVAVNVTMSGGTKVAEVVSSVTFNEFSGCLLA